MEMNELSKASNEGSEATASGDSSITENANSIRSSKIINSLLNTPIGKTYGKVWHALLGTLLTVEEKGVVIFDELVQKGEEFESRTRDTISEKVNEKVASAKSSADDAKEKAVDRWHDLESGLDSNINKALHKLKIPTSNDIDQITQLIGEVSQSVAVLAEQIKAQSKKPATSSKTSKSSSKDVA